MSSVASAGLRPSSEVEKNGASSFTEKPKVIFLVPYMAIGVWGKLRGPFGGRGDVCRVTPHNLSKDN